MNKTFFVDPTGQPDYSISGFWFWNDLITDDKTSEQLAMMKRIHANQPVVHSRSGLINEYLSDDWFDRIAHVIEECRENNQRIWLYDENNWPSGNCAWTITKEEKYREHFLQFEKTTLAEGERFCLDLSGRNYIHVTAFAGGEATDLLAGSHECVDYTSRGQTLVCAVYVDVDPYEKAGKFSVDYLSHEAIRVFIDKTHEKYAERFADEFGKIISGIFMDETRFCNAMPWTQSLPAEFKKRKGYDIVPHLALLTVKNSQSNRIRYDYYDVISDLYVEATFKQVYDWCEARGLQATGHFLGEETLATQSYFGADMMRGYQYFHVPGIDHLGNGIGSLDAKFASSASHHYGRNRIACEAFGAAGWDITFEDMVRISNWLFQQGINLIMMHGFYYSIRDERYRDFPPSYFYQWKYWDHMPMYVLMANRMMEMLSNGRHEADILVYAPMETFWNHFEPDLAVKTGFWRNGPWIRNERAAFIDHQFQLLCNGLTDRNLDYDILGADMVRNFVVEGQELVNTASGERFKVLVLPLAEVLTDETVRLINRFVAAGGKVVSWESRVEDVVMKNGGHMRDEPRPDLDQSKIDCVERLADVFVYCRDHTELPFTIVCGVDSMAHSHSSYPAHLIDPYIHDGERVYGVGVTRYLKDGSRILNVTNYNEKDEALKIRVKSRAIPELFIPETGQIIPQSDAEQRGDEYVVSVCVPKNRTYFIVCAL